MSRAVNGIPGGAPLGGTFWVGRQANIGSDGQRGRGLEIWVKVCCGLHIRATWRDAHNRPIQPAPFGTSPGFIGCGSADHIHSPRNFLVSSPALISLNQALILSTIGRSVAAGSITPIHSSSSIGTPASFIVGMSGAAETR